VWAVAAGLIAGLMVGAGAALPAERLPAPTGPVILTITGAITRTNAPGAARFDRSMLQALGLVSVKTSTVWTDGVKLFEGVPLRQVLDFVGADGTRIRASALNDYEIEIPIDDLRYGPVLALSMDGRALSVRSRGPLWIVYPRDAYSDLGNAMHDARWVWQVNRLAIEP
jgi:hypothetical protein